VDSVALDLDSVLADTRPLWRDWLEDAARRTRVELDLPDDRNEAAARLDQSLGDWRPLLQRFAADRGPLHFRPRAETSAALRRLERAGVRIGVFTDAPLELAEMALAHVGAARRIAVVGSLDEVLRALGPGTVVVHSRAELADLQ
jgi:phosphoglycolate phosphatase-like HAD superfamily hydrolase